MWGLAMTCIWEENFFRYQLKVNKINLYILKEAGEDSDCCKNLRNLKSVR
jgi:hypothetical protein